MKLHILVIMMSLLMGSISVVASDSCNSDGPFNFPITKILNGLKKYKPDKAQSENCQALQQCSLLEELSAPPTKCFGLSKEQLKEYQEQNKRAQTTCERYDELISKANQKLLQGGVCNLSQEEIAMLSYYTGNGYYCLNSILRHDIKASGFKNLVTLVNSGLDKLPSYEGYVLRGASLPKSERAKHQKGKTVTYKGFTSTSTSKGFGGEDQFIILSRTGKPIMGFSAIPGENEVLFKANTSFKVLDTYKKSGINFYILKEIVLGEKPSEQKEEEKRILKNIKEKKSENLSNSSSNGDTWGCPIDKDQEVEKNIQQIEVPNLYQTENYDED